MLKVPSLDDQSYEVIFERARARIPALTGEWTDLNHHDPGITTLQAFAWLADTLQYYMNATGEEHRLKYLKLLGIAPRWAASAGHVALEGNGRAVLGRGCKLLADKTVFELQESYSAALNSLKTLYSEAKGKFVDLGNFAGKDGGFAQIFPDDAGAGAALYFGFENPLGAAVRPGGQAGARDRVRFYVEVQPAPQRGPLDEGCAALADFAWEYYNGEGWQPAALAGDETCGFLRSGFITLGLAGRTALLLGHKALPEAFYLRARMVDNQYDLLPRIGAVLCNCVPVRQTDTLAEAMELEYDGSGRLPIDYHVAEGQQVSVAVAEGAGYSLWCGPALEAPPLCEVAPGAESWQRVVLFDKKRFGAAPEAGSRVLVTVAHAAFEERAVIGVTTGMAGQRLATDLENLYSLRLALVRQKDGRPWYRLWDAWQNDAAPACDAPVFSLKDGGATVQFGDGMAGLQPESGLQVRMVAAATSLLDGGNVLKNQIGSFAGKAPEGLKVYNPQDTTGGQCAKTSHQLEEEIAGKMYSLSRAVSAEDYADIVKSTPGLIIEGVAVISAKDYAAFYPRQAPEYAGTVLVAVKPRDARSPRPELSEAYTRIIQRHIEDYRLVTTQVKVIPARYAGVEAYGRIRLADNTPAAQKRVLGKLEELLDSARSGQFGKTVVYGRVFSHLEMLEEVRAVVQLTLSCIGDSARKNQQGDVLVAPDAMTFLAGSDIEFT